MKRGKARGKSENKEEMAARRKLLWMQEKKMNECRTKKQWRRQVQRENKRKDRKRSKKMIKGEAGGNKSQKKNEWKVGRWKMSKHRRKKGNYYKRKKKREKIERWVWKRKIGTERRNGRQAEAIVECKKGRNGGRQCGREAASPHCAFHSLLWIVSRTDRGGRPASQANQRPSQLCQSARRLLPPPPPAPFPCYQPSPSLSITSASVL